MSSLRDDLIDRRSKKKKKKYYHVSTNWTKKTLNTPEEVMQFIKMNDRAGTTIIVDIIELSNYFYYKYHINEEVKDEGRGKT